MEDDVMDVRQSTLKQIADDEPQRHDLFIGLVAPLGSSRAEVVSAVTDVLSSYGYDVEPVHLAGFLDSVQPQDQPLPSRGEVGYYKQRMDAGDRLRKAAGDWSGLAALAVAWVARHRRRRKGQDVDPEPRPVAYIFNSLKHPREADLLRSVYGKAFWLVSIVQDVSERTKNLADDLARDAGRVQPAPEAQAIDLITRDEADPDAPHGQHVRDVFAEADFFIPVQRGVAWRGKLDRLFRGIFGDPFLTPYADEEAMRHAQAAALRSAAIGRQVGAVIVPALGAPYLLGTNEVPKPGGGQYREGDQPDHRDFQSGADPNPAYTGRVIRELIDRLAKAQFFTNERNAAGGEAILREAMVPDAEGKSILDDTRARSLIEFTRCLHAEQAAVVDAARTGTAVAGGKLFTTTFPCHECAKFIVGAGIIEVQYIEPYPKSLVGDLYRDLIDTRPPIELRSERLKEGAKIPFRPFLGFGPSRYDEVFTATQRRAGDRLAVLKPLLAVPVGSGWSEIAVRSRESEVGLIAGSLVEELSSKSSGNEEPQGSSSVITARETGTDS